MTKRHRMGVKDKEQKWLTLISQMEHGRNAYYVAAAVLERKMLRSDHNGADLQHQVLTVVQSF